MSFRIRGSPPFMPNHLTPKLWISSTKCKASFVVNSLGACSPVASTLQYLHRALQAPVALQEVISNGLLFAKLNLSLNSFRYFIFHLAVLALKKILPPSFLWLFDCSPIRFANFE